MNKILGLVGIGVGLALLAMYHTTVDVVVGCIGIASGIVLLLLPSRH